MLPYGEMSGEEILEDLEGFIGEVIPAVREVEATTARA